MAVHGAGMANMLFCNPSCKIVELEHENGVPEVFKLLSQELGIENYTSIKIPGLLNAQDEEKLKEKLFNFSNNVLPLKLSAELIDFIRNLH